MPHWNHRSWCERKGSLQGCPSRAVRRPYYLAPTPISVVADVACVATHVAAVMIDIAIFTAQFLAFLACSGVVAIAQVSTKLPLIMCDLCAIISHVAIV